MVVGLGLPFRPSGVTAAIRRPLPSLRSVVELRSHPSFFIKSKKPQLALRFFEKWW